MTSVNLFCPGKRSYLFLPSIFTMCDKLSNVCLVFVSLMFGVPHFGAAERFDPHVKITSNHNHGRSKEFLKKLKECIA